MVQMAGQKGLFDPPFKTFKTRGPAVTGSCRYNVPFLALHFGGPLMVWSTESYCLPSAQYPPPTARQTPLPSHHLSRLSTYPSQGRRCLTLRTRVSCSPSASSPPILPPVSIPQRRRYARQSQRTLRRRYSRRFLRIGTHGVMGLSVAIGSLGAV